MLDNAFPARFAVAALATWRVSHLIAHEDGPWNLVARARARAGSSELGELMDCFYCLSLWVGAPAALTVARGRALPAARLAVSGAACLLERITHREKGAWDVLWEEPARSAGLDEADAREPRRPADAQAQAAASI